MRPIADAPAGLWAITTYFNPLGYRRRRSNFAHFRRNLGLPLLVVELAYGSGFAIADEDADIIVRVEGGDVMWQKERLLNLALSALPPECTAIAWVDCDVVFERSDWAGEAVSLLDRHPLIQPFEHQETMPEDWLPGDPAPVLDDQLRPASRHIADGASPDTIFLNRPSWMRMCSGVAWVARRSLLARHGFYDACILGGGDHAMVSAAYGRFESAFRRQKMNAAFRDHYLAWAREFSTDVAGNTGHLPGRVLHLWHGPMEYRAYHARHVAFADFDFDPDADIVHDMSGAWRWRTYKPDMHRYVRDYLQSRKEDG
jgi:hypothetical protein